MMSSRPSHVPLPGDWKPHLKKVGGVWFIVNNPARLRRLMREEEMDRFIEAITYMEKQDKLLGARRISLGDYILSEEE